MAKAGADACPPWSFLNHPARPLIDPSTEGVTSWQECPTTAAPPGSAEPRILHSFARRWQIGCRFLFAPSLSCVFRYSERGSRSARKATAGTLRSNRFPISRHGGLCIPRGVRGRAVTPRSGQKRAPTPFPLPEAHFGSLTLPRRGLFRGLHFAPRSLRPRSLSSPPRSIISRYSFARSRLPAAGRIGTGKKNASGRERGESSSVAAATAPTSFSAVDPPDGVVCATSPVSGVLFIYFSPPFAALVPPSSALTYLDVMPGSPPALPSRPHSVVINYLVSFLPPYCPIRAGPLHPGRLLLRRLFFAPAWLSFSTRLGLAVRRKQRTRELARFDRSPRHQLKAASCATSLP